MWVWQPLLALTCQFGAQPVLGPATDVQPLVITPQD